MFPFNITQENINLLNYINYQAQKNAYNVLYPPILPHFPTQTQTSDFLPCANLPRININQNIPSLFNIPSVPLNFINTPVVPREGFGVVNRKRKLSSVEEHEKIQAALLATVQKEKKAEREKERRQLVSELYSELSLIVTSLNLTQKESHKLQRIEILNCLVELMCSKQEKLEEYKSGLLEHKVVKPREGITKKKLKSTNEKIRRDKLRFVLDTLASIVNVRTSSDQSDILSAILERLKKGE